MASPTLPPPVPDGIYSLRFYETGTATADFDDSKWSFTHPSDDDKQAWSKGILISAATADLEFSFDGVNVHGKVIAGTTAEYIDRTEGGIYVRGNTSVFKIFAW